ncbi:DUF72 domain-containing protein [Streptomyces sp. MST-110588]|uniref:DUF72 domain-containing protein n=1 Tax=Streptomyces sp. MST-110588 TaxID=2833628 RepID=UPI002049A444|nr:DUF72 domain-containing protein [Streptomyces sp. MST-110588]
MADILVGTCSWTDPALVASGWYPADCRDPAGRLRYYASRLPVVEVDSTYYGLPSTRNSALWAGRTPGGFVFDVKAFAPLTGHMTRAGSLPKDLRPAGPPQRPVPASALPPDVLDELWSRYLGALRPLADAGRLGALLFQYPPWFGPGPGAEEQLVRCRERTAGLRVAVEFRHRDWLAPGNLERTTGFLRERDMALVAVDTAQGLRTSMPPVAVATSPALSVLRFHGRSPAWSSGGKEDRYRHRYAPGELASWVPRVRTLARHSAEVHVLFNNCCGDAAVRAAEMMTDLLEEAGLSPRPGLSTGPRASSVPTQLSLPAEQGPEEAGPGPGAGAGSDPGVGSGTSAGAGSGAGYGADARSGPDARSRPDARRASGGPR